MPKWIDIVLVFLTVIYIICVFAELIVVLVKGNTRKLDESVPNVTWTSYVVQTKYGPVMGTDNGKVRIFHGVPYARSPTGNFRWRPPVEPEPWTDVFDARTKRPGCPQECSSPLFCTKQTSEDCLFLEIYAPSNATFPVPVMVYLHGGSFKYMSSTMTLFDSTNLVKRAEVVVVHIEFRIGTLGFLVTGTSEGDAEGNFGLLDQRLALVWVHENIRAFGGDPDKVTLAGQSSGAQSVLIHLVSQESSPYFRSAIVESSPITLKYQTQEAAIKRAQTFAAIMGCLVNNSTNISVACLRNINVDTVLQAQKLAGKSVVSFQERFEPWGPVIDGKIVTGQALTALQTFATRSGEMKPLVFGYTADEALMHVRSVMKTPVTNLSYGLFLGIELGNTSNVINKLYPVTNGLDAREDLTVLFTDAIFRCPLRQVVQLLTSRNPKVWVYKWDTPLAVDMSKALAFCAGRSCHGTQIAFVFQTLFQMFGEENPEVIRISNIIIDYYSNFIKFGDPNGEETLGDQSATDPILDAGYSPEAASIYWPAARGIKVGVLTELLFARDRHLEVTNQSNDSQCTAWDSSKYIFGRN